MRTITIHASPRDGETDADRWQQFAEQCGGTDAQIREAIGYLSLWNWSTYPIVSILLAGEAGNMELTAFYRKERGEPAGYVIGAVWHDGHFGFHS
jgi:hypothetical protein